MPATPLSHWIGFHLGLLLLLAIELVYARRQNRRGRGRHHTAVVLTVGWTVAALAFALYVRHYLGPGRSIEYITGYAIEESLSIDNLFVFLLLFRVFQIEPKYQPKVLFWGVAGAMVMRGLFIVAGISLLEHFEAVTYVFAAILLIAAVRLVMPSSSEEEGAEPAWIRWLKRWHPISMRQDRFVVHEDGRRMVTVLLLTLIAIELTDVVFALDSIPAVLSITRHPFLAYTSNIMAVMGLRSLYFVLIAMLTRMRYLHYGLAVILGFAAVKMFVSKWIDIGPLVSLGVILGVLAITVIASVLSPAKQAA